MSVMITLALCSSLTALAEYGWRIHQRAEENEQDCQHNMDEGLWFFEKWRHMKWLNDWLRVFSQTSSTVFPESKEFIESLHARDLLLVTCVQTSKSIWNTENNEINYTGQNQNFIGLKLLSSRQPQKSFRWLAQDAIRKSEYGRAHMFFGAGADTRGLGPLWFHDKMSGPEYGGKVESYGGEAAKNQVT